MKLKAWIVLVGERTVKVKSEDWVINVNNRLYFTVNDSIVAIFNDWTYVVEQTVF